MIFVNTIRSCGDHVEGSVSDNLLGFVPGVETVNECSQLCRDTEECSYITFYDRDHHGMAETCFLLNSLREPIKSCEHCETSPIDCSVSNCGFLDYNGTMISSGAVLTESTVLTTLRLGKCSALLRVLAVGGGGRDGYFSGGICHYASGGGSGYITYEEISLLNDTVAQNFQIDVIVGEKQSYPNNNNWKSTSVTITTEDTSMDISAEPGNDGYADGAGGSGYSGGGGHGRSCLNDPLTPGGDGGCHSESPLSGPFGARHPPRTCRALLDEGGIVSCRPAWPWQAH